MRTPVCQIHKIHMVSFCPACRGEVRTVKKATAARQNGKKGGRPRRAQGKRLSR